MDPRAIKDRDRCRLLKPVIAPDRDQEWNVVRWFPGEYGRLKGHWVHRRRDLQVLWRHGEVQRTCCNQIHGLISVDGTRQNMRTVFLGNNSVEARANISELSDLFAQTLPPPKSSPQKWMRVKLPRTGASTMALLQSDRYNLRGWLLRCLEKDLDHLTYHDLLPFGNDIADNILHLLAYQLARDRLQGVGLEGVSLGAKWQHLHHALQPCSVCDRLLILKTVPEDSEEDRYTYTVTLEGRKGQIISAGESLLLLLYYYIMSESYFLSLVIGGVFNGPSRTGE